MPDQYFDMDNPGFEGSFHSNGQIFWYATEYINRLGYKDYSPTMPPINKAMTVCLSIPSIMTADHFREELRIIDNRPVKDFKLSRFACYLIAMNADIKKEAVAGAQAYFAAFTAQIHEFIKGNEDFERVMLRKEISIHEKSLYSSAEQAGIEIYPYFTNKGYMGLYNMPINKLRKLKNVPDGKTPLDYMGAEELGANIFRITQTDAKIKREHIRGQTALENAALQVGRTVRNAIKENGGTMPEDLPAEVHVKKIQSDLNKTSKEFTKKDRKLTGKPSSD
jgi:DNA-damage-inducible protein D